MKNFLSFLLPTLLCLSLHAQKVETIYSVKVATIKEAKTDDVFNKLKPYGILKFEASDQGVRVYLRSYLDKGTAIRIRDKVRSLGFKDAFIVSDSHKLSHKQGKYYSHTYQVASFRKLNLTKANAILSTNDIGDELYVQYNKGKYRISVGLYSPDIPGTKEDCMAMAIRLKTLVGDKGYGRKFRSVPSLPKEEAPRP